MPGRLFLDLAGAELARHLGMSAGTVPEDPPRRNIAPGQQVIAITPQGLGHMRWGMIPVGRVNARGRPVMETLINARSETLFEKTAYAGTGRAVVPVSGWYEWTGEARRKTAWRIADRNGALLFFAAVTDVWHGPGDIRVPQLATVTTAPNADLRDIHHRMGVLLAEADIPVWLEGDEAAARTLMVPWPDGRFRITQARDVDWDAP